MPVTVADVLTACAGLAPDTLVIVETHDGFEWPLEVYPQSSDAVPGPCGTDPMTESTVGRLIVRYGE